MSSRVWDGVRPLLEDQHEVVALDALGHRGGAAAARRPAGVRDLVDDAERALDERHLERPHVAGNSVGGWMAIELARRGRAATACALSPAGSWTAGTAEQTAGVRKIRRAIWSARMSRALPMSLLLRSAMVRRGTLPDLPRPRGQLTPAPGADPTPEPLRRLLGRDHLNHPQEDAPPH